MRIQPILMLVLAGSVLAGCSGAKNHSLKQSGITLSSSQLTEVDERSRKQWRSILNWPSSCELAFNVSHAGDDSGIEYYSSTGEFILVSVLCAAGAYQPSFRYYLVETLTSDAVAVPVRLPTYQSPDGRYFEQVQHYEVWGEPNFIEDTGELTILNLSRQTGDCGTWARYGFNGTQPELQEVWTRLPCPKDIQEPADPVSPFPPTGWEKVEIE